MAMKLYSSILMLFFASVMQCQRMDTINGEVYSHLKCGLWKDTKNNVYFSVYDSVNDMHKRTSNIRVEGSDTPLKTQIDTTTFYRYKKFPFAKDKKNVYFIPFYNADEDLDKHISILKEADPKTFAIIPRSMYEAEDQNYNYYYKKNSLEVISKTMNYEDLGKGFYKGDNGKLYIKTSVNHDPGGTNKWSKWFYREVPNIDVETFKYFGSAYGYAKDKNYIYYISGTTDGNFIELVEKADLKTFKVDPSSYTSGKDKNYSFENGHAK
jgi:hypothetical protein